MQRRDYLKLLTAGGAGLVAGCPGQESELDATRTPDNTTPPGEPPDTQTPDEATPSPASDYGTVVDVREAGADPTGASRIDDVLEETYGSDTLLVFPEGRYRVGQQVFEDVEHFGIVGENATLVPADPGPSFLLSFRRVADLHVSGLTVDQSADGVCGSLRFRCVGGSNLVRDVRLTGFVDRPERIQGVIVFCEGRETSLTFERLGLTDGARNGTGVFVFPQRAFTDTNRAPGRLVFRDCQMYDWRAEGLYASPHGGPLAVIGGHFENNAIDQVRIGSGNADTAALVKDVTAVVDGPPASLARGERGNFRGIWLEEGSNATIDGCTVEIRDLSGGHSQGGIVVSEQFGRAEIRNTDIRTDSNVPALLIDRRAPRFDASSMPSLDHLPTDWVVTCQNLRIYGSSDAGAAIRLGPRSNCVFDGVEIDQRRGERHGLSGTGATDTKVYGGHFTTSGYPVLVGSAAGPVAGTRLLCFGGSVSLRSTRLNGTPLDEERDAGGDSVCVPSTLLPADAAKDFHPYLGLTRAENQQLFGQQLSAKWRAGDFVWR